VGSCSRILGGEWGIQKASCLDSPLLLLAVLLSYLDVLFHHEKHLSYQQGNIKNPLGKHCALEKFPRLQSFDLLY
jgi:hypothetical protein